jgi:hypothetical protein
MEEKPSKVKDLSIDELLNTYSAIFKQAFEHRIKTQIILSYAEDAEDKEKAKEFAEKYDNMLIDLSKERDHLQKCIEAINAPPNISTKIATDLVRYQGNEDHDPILNLEVNFVNLTEKADFLEDLQKFLDDITNIEASKHHYSEGNMLDVFRDHMEQIIQKINSHNNINPNATIEDFNQIYLGMKKQWDNAFDDQNEITKYCLKGAHETGVLGTNLLNFHTGSLNAQQEIIDMLEELRAKKLKESQSPNKGRN